MDKLIIAPFNAVYLGTLMVFIAILVLGSIYLNRKSERTREIALSVFCLIFFVMYFYYKYQVSIDEEYTRICLETGQGSGTFNIASYLPLHLCNINLWLLPVAVLSRNTYLKAFPFYFGSAGAMMALATPGIGYSGYSLLVPRVWGFYFTHFAVLISCIALLTLGLFKPSFKLIPKSLLFIEGINLFTFLVNVFFVYTGIWEYANFMFSMSPSGNPVLKFFWSILPVPFLYQNLLAVMIIPYILIVTAIYQAVMKRKRSEGQ